MEHLCTRTRWQLITPSRPPASAGGRFFMPHAEESDDTVIHCSSPSATNHTHHLQTGLAAVTHPCSRPGSPHPTAAHGHSVHPFRGGRLSPRLALCNACTLTDGCLGSIDAVSHAYPCGQGHYPYRRFRRTSARTPHQHMHCGCASRLTTAPTRRCRGGSGVNSVFTWCRARYTRRSRFHQTWSNQLRQ